MEETSSTVISLLTDFGLRDPYVACMKGVILGINPRARLVDVTHEVGVGEVEEAGFLLASCYAWFPRGTVHLAVVDPGVGTPRRALLLAAGGHLFVGPDNGLFTALLDGGEDWRAYELTNGRYHLDPVSRTFHGRDVFAPVAAWLSRGLAPEAVGSPIGDPRRSERFPPPRLEAAGTIAGVVVHLDRFGNAITNIGRGLFAAAGSGGGEAGFSLELPGGGTVGRLVGCYAEGGTGEAMALFGSSGYLEVAVDRGSAAERLGLRRGDAVRVHLGAPGGGA